MSAASIVNVVTNIQSQEIHTAPSGATEALLYSFSTHPAVRRKNCNKR